MKPFEFSMLFLILIISSVAGLCFYRNTQSPKFKVGDCVRQSIYLEEWQIDSDLDELIFKVGKHSYLTNWAHPIPGSQYRILPFSNEDSFIKVECPK